MQIHKTGPETERLIHRSLRVEDAEAFFALNSHPDVMRYTGEPAIQSLEEAREAIENYPDFDTFGYGRWGCFLKETQELIGFCGLKYLTELEMVDVGYRFLPEYWGEGFATEACTASVDFGFDVLGLKQIFGFVLSQNGASIRVLEKVGFCEIGPYMLDGEKVLQYEIS